MKSLEYEKYYYFLRNDCLKTQPKTQCKGYAYKTTEITLQSHKVLCFYSNVTTLRSGICRRNSVRLSVVCNVRAPYSCLLYTSDAADE